MTPDLRHVEAIFNEVADLPRDQRAAALEARCAGDVELRARVEGLLAQIDADTVNILRTPAQFDLAHLAEKPGDVIDRFRLVELIGEGGFGVVYRAEQTEPVRRDVALKIVKLGMDTRRIVARFEAERQTLAMMDHAGVARVIDAGSTATGRPYFVMDLVRGEPITDFAVRRQLSTEAILHLVIQVCDAVQHAHQKGVIHRDLKPSNILVADADQGPAARVIDFGIARAIDQRRLSEQTFTADGHIIGTPEYMSPEQAAGEDVDTRADIYALGVILYELLTRTLPHDPESLRSRGLAGVRQAILEQDPPRPSARAAAKPETRPIARRLRGDLDWITMKALEKDRLRRYAAASELAADLGRFLRHEPVLAGPPSRAYRASKFIARHRVPVGAAAFILLAVMAGAVASTVGFVRATRAESLARAEADRARIAEADARTQAERAMAAEKDARAQAARSTAVTDFLVNMLRSADPEQSGGGEVTVRELLDESSDSIDRDFGSDPPVAAALHAVVGDVYRTLNQFDKAEPHMRQSLDLHAHAMGEDSAEAAQALHEWSVLLEDRGRYEEAEAASRRALELRTAIHGEGSPEVGATLGRLGAILSRRGRQDQAEPYLVRSLEIRRAVHAPPHEAIAGALDALGRLYYGLARYKESEPLLREALEMRAAVHGESHAYTASTANNLGSLYHDTRRFAEAEPLYLRALAAQRQIYPGDHTTIARTLNNLASLYQDQGDYDRAEPMFVESLEMRRRLYPSDHPVVINAVNNLAVIRYYKGDRAGAEVLFAEVVDLRRRVLGPDHPEVAYTLSSLSACYKHREAYEEALPLLDEAIRILTKSLGETHPRLTSVLHNQAEIQFRLKRFEEAERGARRSLAIHAANPQGDAHPNALSTWALLTGAVLSQDRSDEVRAVLDQAAPKMLAFTGRVTPTVSGALESTAVAAEKVGRTETADALRARLAELNAATPP